jgi:hypothetical protein
MIVYEVDAKVNNDLCAEFERYVIETHIPDLLATGYFQTASFDSDSAGGYRIRYFAETREELEKYLAEEAPRLREDVAVHFPEGLELSRQEWTVLKHFA